MRKLKEYHHFKSELIEPDDRVSRYERYVVDLLLESDLADSERESTTCWELKHQASMRQFAAILARKRALPIDICIVGVLLHDICSVIHGVYKDHAHRGADIATKILNELGGFSKEEQNQIWQIVYHHSDKDIWSDDAFQEFGKDVDVLDTFLYEGAYDYYLGHKPLPVFKEYAERAKSLWHELGIPIDPRLTILDGYGPSWFEEIGSGGWDGISHFLAIVCELTTFPKEIGISPPPFCIKASHNVCQIFACRTSWNDYVYFLTSQAGPMPSPKKSATVGLIRSLLTDGLATVGTKEADIDIVDTEQRYGSILSHLSQRATKSPAALLFWPLLDIYEELSGDRLTKRLCELGLQP